MTEKRDLKRMRRKEMKEIAESHNAELVMVVLFSEDEQGTSYIYEAYGANVELEDHGGDILDQFMRIAEGELEPA